MSRIHEEILNLVSDVIYYFQFFPEAKYTFVSNSIIRLTGYTPEDHYKDPNIGVKIVHSEDQHKINNLYILSQHGSFLLEIRWITKSGRIIFTEQQINPVFEDDQLIGLVGVVREKKRDTQILKNHEYMSVLTSICSYCKRIKTESGWSPLEFVLDKKLLSHAYCEDCAKLVMSEI